jgi:GTP-binding protein EngB required for normal cell division
VIFEVIAALNADFHGAKLRNIPGYGFAEFARKIAESADKMLIDLFRQMGL